MTERVDLMPVDRVEVSVLVENSIDTFLVDDAIAKRPIRTYEPPPDKPRAEHGIALLLRIAVDGHTSSVLYDAGLGRDTVVHNLDVLGVPIADLRAIVLSHGHPDHHGGLEGLARRTGSRAMPLVLHPDAWRDRKVVLPTGVEMHAPPPRAQDLAHEGVVVVEERGPSLLLDGSVLVTGEVERQTEFEQGFPLQWWNDGSGWRPDPMVRDDQAVVVHVRGRGLVILTACSHAGAINIVEHARTMTGVSHIHGLIGGLHLSGTTFEPLIAPTVAGLIDIAPDVIVPGHCTGWRAVHEIARRLPGAFIQTSVGTRLEFVAEGRST